MEGGCAEKAQSKWDLAAQPTLLCEYYFDLQRWSEVPSWFKPWSEHELNSRTLRAWSPGNLHGLLQTEDYARALNEIEPRVTGEQVADRVANRMARQQRVLFRDDPPEACFLVSVTSLRNMPAGIAGNQLRHLLASGPASPGHDPGRTRMLACWPSGRIHRR